MEAMTMGERRRIIQLYGEGWKTHRIAEALGRSRSGVRRIRQQHRERGVLAPQPRGGGRPPKLNAAGDRELLARVAARPDATLDELAADGGLGVSRSTIDRHLRKLRISFKKKWSMPQSRSDPTWPSGGPTGS